MQASVIITALYFFSLANTSNSFVFWPKNEKQQSPAVPVTATALTDWILRTRARLYPHYNTSFTNETFALTVYNNSINSPYYNATLPHVQRASSNTINYINQKEMIPEAVGIPEVGVMIEKPLLDKGRIVFSKEKVRGKYRYWNTKEGLKSDLLHNLFPRNMISDPITSVDGRILRPCKEFINSWNSKIDSTKPVKIKSRRGKLQVMQKLYGKLGFGRKSFRNTSERSWLNEIDFGRPVRITVGSPYRTLRVSENLFGNVGLGYSSDKWDVVRVDRSTLEPLSMESTTSSAVVFALRVAGGGEEEGRYLGAFMQADMKVKGKTPEIRKVRFGARLAPLHEAQFFESRCDGNSKSKAFLSVVNSGGVLLSASRLLDGLEFTYDPRIHPSTEFQFSQ